MTTGTLAIETRGLSRFFGTREAVRSLDLQVRRGGVYGFLGLNGAGKSTTIRMLLGLLLPDCGSVKVAGRDPLREGVELRRRVGYVPDAPTFYEWMTVGEIMAFTAHYRLPDWDWSFARKLAHDFDLQEGRVLKSLSKGERTRVSLLLALAFHPEVLILDEPTSGLDPVMRRQVVEDVLDEYLAGGDRTVLISSHLVNEIAGLVDTVGFLKKGVLLRSGPTDEVRADVKRVRLEFPGDAPRSVQFPGLLRQRSRGRELVVSLEGFARGEVAEGLRHAAGATSATVEDLSLEDIFVELMSGPGGEAP